MSGTDYSKGISVFGVPVLPGMGGSVFTGNVFFVDSGAPNASDEAGQGKKIDRPFGTLDFAVGRTAPNNGDLIIVMPGHTETVTAAAGLGLDVAGISILGLGQGSSRPTINFTTVVGADMNVDAANITMSNFLFTGGIDALTGPIDINAPDFKLLNFETRDVTGQAADFIVTDANADRLLIDGWAHRGDPSAGAQTAISIIGGDDLVIRNFNLYGNFATAAIENVTTACVRANIGGGAGWNYIWTENAADKAITMVSTARGFIGPNICAILQDDAANITEAFVGGDMAFMQPIRIVNADGESSIDTNITPSADSA